MIKLSEHFNLSEFTYSDTAKKYGVENNPTPIHLKTLIHTCNYCLEKLRALLVAKYKTYKGSPVKNIYISITSGYRSKTVNQLLKKEGYNPSETSQHCNGEAADIEVKIYTTDNIKIVMPYNELYQDIKSFVKNGQLSVDQCIQEKQGSKMWVHISYSASGSTKNRKQFLKYLNGKYTLD